MILNYYRLSSVSAPHLVNAYTRAVIGLGLGSGLMLELCSRYDRVRSDVMVTVRIRVK